MSTGSQKLYFDSIKLDRDWYFVEYRPPIPSHRFATLQLVTPTDRTKEEIVQAMEAELKTWLELYPVPLMVSAFDSKGGLYDLTGLRACNHLMGFPSDDGQDLHSSWRLFPDQELPDRALDENYLRTVYTDIGFKSSEDLRRQSDEVRRASRIGWLVVFVWAVVIPTALAARGESESAG